MADSYQTVYNRLVVTAREQSYIAIHEKGIGERAYAPNTAGFSTSSMQDHSQADKQLEAAKQGWQFSAIKLIATACANQPIRVGVQRGRKKTEGISKAFQFRKAPDTVKAISEQIDIINVHPIVDMVENPNSLPAGLEFSLKFCTVFSIMATGYAYWLVIPKKSGGHSLYYMPCTWVTPVVNNGGDIIGWSIKGPSQQEPIPVPFDYIIPFVIPDPSHPAYALSILQTQSRPVNTDDKIMTAQYRAMEQGIYPGLALHVAPIKSPSGQETIPELSSEQRKQLIDTVMTAASGANNFGMPFILDGMIEKISQITNKPNDMAFTEFSKAMRERIFLAYGVNPIVAGLVEGANRASSFVAHEQFYRTVVNPILCLMGQALTKYLGPRFAQNKRLYVWFEEAQPYDSDAFMRQMRDLASFSSITKNEYREGAGLPPIEGGDKLIEPPLKQKPAAGIGRPPGT